MAMVPYVIRQGDHLVKLATRMGFEVDAVWGDSKNADLRAKRPDFHQLCAGDILYVPERDAEWHSVSPGSTASFATKVQGMKISASFSRAGKPLANAACVVHGLPAPNEMTTDGDGKLTFTAPVNVGQVTVEFKKPHFIQRLKLGHLDPIDEPSGVYQRLQNLHVQSRQGPLPAEFDPTAMGEALASFQQAQGLEVTGEVDDATRDKLRASHGS
ncbi:MAG: peptidoglycan-binding domain-containing protein [Polyangiaceae bacterium]